MNIPDLSLLKSRVFHGRSGNVQNAFSYRADFVWLRIDSERNRLPRLFSFEYFNVWSLRKKDYGDGTKTLRDRADWLRMKSGVNADGLRVYLLTQPACIGYAFNPVSFWFFLDSAGRLRAVVSEVNNTSGDRHCYIARHGDERPILRGDIIALRKVFHVSPFQPIDGDYEFSFGLDEAAVHVRIAYNSESDDGLMTSVTGQFTPLTSLSILKSAIALPLGAARVMGLIFWQALKLKIKGARFRSRPIPPAQDFSS